MIPRMSAAPIILAEKRAMVTIAVAVKASWASARRARGTATRTTSAKAPSCVVKPTAPGAAMIVAGLFCSDPVGCSVSPNAPIKTYKILDILSQAAPRR